MGLVSYGVYGLRLDCGRELVTGLRSPRAGMPAIAVSFGEFAEGPEGEVIYESSGRNPRGLPYLSVRRPGPGELRLRHEGDAGRAEFAVRAEAVAVHSEGVAPGDLEAYLLGPVLGCLLRLRGVLTLHGCVVAAGGAAVALTGPKGAGKSTLAAALGLPVLSDDLVPIEGRDGQPWVEPGYPRVRLWQDTVAAVASAGAGFPRVLEGCDKFMVPVDRFGAEPLPLRAVLQIADGPEPALQELGEAQAVAVLMGARYAPYLGSASGDLAAAADLARRCRVLRLCRPVGLARLLEAAPALADAITGSAAR